ncbi:hypothetical protein Pan241w_05090 [Gimesia alba]|uniref:Uncharacterized protein n=1 Tax=Gimesia alba TaxID=2527973 RepID=A0A517R993_9PLAN|nr:hypothetical protein [Gimesia alba]QDT40452.1 hypothetical protein Pan241w_05090 [Gimesia alba]
MNKPPDHLQQTISKTAIAALKWNAAAIMSHFQSQRGTPPLAGTTCSSPQFTAMDARLFELCSVSDNLTDEVSKPESANSGSKLLHDIAQEMIRLNNRIMKSLIDCVPSVLCRRNTIPPKRSARYWIFYFSGRLQTGTLQAKIRSMQETSVSSATEEEYNFRRETTRQRVFHEKGNAD